MNAHHSKNKWLTYSSQCNSKSRMSSCSRTGAVLPEPIQMALCSCSCPNCQTLERWHERLGLTAALLAFREQQILQSHLWHPVLIRDEPVHTKHMSLGTHQFFLLGQWPCCAKHVYWVKGISSRPYVGPLGSLWYMVMYLMWLEHLRRFWTMMHYLPGANCCPNPGRDRGPLWDIPSSTCSDVVGNASRNREAVHTIEPYYEWSWGN